MLSLAWLGTHRICFPSLTATGLHSPGLLPSRGRKGGSRGVGSAMECRKAPAGGREQRRRDVAQVMQSSAEEVLGMVRLGSGQGEATVHHLCGGGLESWAIHVKGYWPLEGTSFDALWGSHPDEFGCMRIMGREIPVPRWQKMFGSVEYAYAGAPNTPTERMEKQEQCREFQERVHEALGLPEETYNGCLVNWYDGERGHYQGPHKDNERAMVKGMPIFSMSWGETRRFRLKHDGRQRHPPGVELKGVVDSLTVELGHGDLLVMGGDCQVTHKHEIMKLRKGDGRGRRVNLTLRAFHK